MQVNIQDYFASKGFSPDQLAAELTSTYRMRVHKNKIILCHFKFLDELAYYSTDPYDVPIVIDPSSPEYIGSTEQTSIISILNAHTPAQVPFVYLYTMPTGATVGNVMITVANLSAISEYNSIFTFTFTVMPVLATLNSQLASYVEPEAGVSVDLVKKASEVHFSTNNFSNIIVPAQPNEIVVSKNSGQFTTIAAAISYINTLPAKNVVIKLFPGTYYETNPLVLPNSSCLIGQGSAANTIIIGTGAGAVLQTTAFNSVKNVTLAGGTIGLQHDGSDPTSFTIFRDSIVQSQTNACTGIVASGGVGSLILDFVSIITPDASAPTTGYAINASGCSVIASDVIIQGTYAAGVYSRSSILTLNIVSIYYCATAIDVANGTTLKSTLLNFMSNTTGLAVSADTGTYNKSIILVGFLNVDNSTTDILMNATANIEIYTAHADPQKITYNVPTKISGTLQKFSNNMSQQFITGNSYVDGTFYMAPPTTQTIYQNYIYAPSTIYGFTTASTITSVQYYNGTLWVTVNFSSYSINGTNLYYLDLAYSPSAVTINSISAQWILLNSMPADIVVHQNSMWALSDRMVYLGNARKQTINYLPAPTLAGTVYFVKPPNTDTSTKYTIIAQGTGITVNGTTYNGYNEIATAWTSNTPESFTTSGTFTLLAVRYNVVYF